MYIYIYIYIYTNVYIFIYIWVLKITCGVVGSIELGRAAARIGPNEGDTKMGVGSSGSLTSLII